MDNEIKQTKITLYQIEITTNHYMYIYVDDVLKVQRINDRLLTVEEVLEFIENYDGTTIGVDNKELFDTLVTLKDSKQLQVNDITLVVRTRPHYILADTMLDCSFTVKKPYNCNVQVAEPDLPDVEQTAHITEIRPTHGDFKLYLNGEDKGRFKYSEDRILATILLTIVNLELVYLIVDDSTIVEEIKTRITALPETHPLKNLIVKQYEKEK